MVSKVDQLFQENVGKCSYVELFRENGKFRGSCIVTFTKEEDAKNAVSKLHNFRYKGTVASVWKNSPINISKIEKI